MSHAGARLTGRHPGGPFGSDPARHPRPPGPGRGDGQRARRALPDLAARDLSPHQGARRRGADRSAGRRDEPTVSSGAAGALRARRLPRDAPEGARTELPTPGSPAGEAEKGQTIMSKLTLETEGDRFVVVKRRFEAPPEAVYRAFMDPELIQQWWLGPDGGTMPVCIHEAKPGGKIRYEWSNGKGRS